MYKELLIKNKLNIILTQLWKSDLAFKKKFILYFKLSIINSSSK